MLPIDKCFSFINVLDQLKQQPAHSYIVQRNGEWQYVFQKQEKKDFNTQALVNIAENCLKTLSLSQCSEAPEQVMWIQKLKEALHIYSKRLYASKAWYWKFLSHLRVKHRVEYKIDRVITQLKFLQKKGEALQKIRQNLRVRCNQPHLLLKGIYHKLLGVNFKKVESLDGFPRCLNYSTLVIDLAKFKATLNKETPDHAIVSQALNELSLAEIINYLIFSDQLSQAKTLIINAIKSLGDPNSPYQSILIPGGWKDHAVVFQIKQELDGNYSFHTIDPDEGYIKKDEKYICSYEYICFHEYFYTSLKKELLEKEQKIVEACKEAGKIRLRLDQDDCLNKEELKQQLQQIYRDIDLIKLQLPKNLSNLSVEDIKDYVQAERYKQKVVDSIIKNLNEADFNPEFFQTLFEYYKDNGLKEKTVQFIRDEFLKSGHSNQVYSQRERHTQKKGVCGIKCLTIWLHDRLGESLHSRFKAFIADEQLSCLDQLANKKLSIADLNWKKSGQSQLESDLKDIGIAGLLQEMQEMGKKVRENRYRKVVELNNSPFP